MKFLLLLFTFSVLVSCVEQIPEEELENEIFTDRRVAGKTDTPENVDNAEPLLSNGLPKGTLPEITSNVVIQISSNEKSICRYDTSDRNYNQMVRSLFPSVDGLVHSSPLAVANDMSYKLYIRCADIAGNQNAASTLISFYIDKKGVVDNTPPIVSGLGPLGELMPGTKSAILKASSNEKSICKYSNDTASTFDAMIGMNSNDGLSHSAAANGLSDGNSYKYYFLCKDLVGNVSAKMSITFSVKELLLDGVALYTNNCLSCHGSLANSSKINKTQTQIQNAINNNGSMKVLAYLKNLAPVQVAKVAEVLFKADKIAPVLESRTVMNLSQTAATIRWQTNELASGQVEYGISTNYGTMSAINNNLLNIHSVNLSGLKAETIYHYRILSIDSAGNKLTSNDFTFKTIAEVDKTLPVLSNLLPTGTLMAGTSQATLSLVTNEAADCRYSTNQAANYADMSAMSSTGMSTHSHKVSGLANGKEYNYFIKCRDKSANISLRGDIKFSVKAVVLLDGGALYRTNCASCHTNAANGLSTKLYASVADIDRGILNINSMKSLSTKISVEEIAAISDYLTKIAPTEKGTGKVDESVTFINILGTRNYIVSKLKTIYSDSSAVSKIDLIKNYPGFFGGTCASQYDSCSGEVSENYNAAMNLGSNVVRRGIIVKVCREIHNIGNAVTSALSYTTIDSEGSAPDTDFKKAIEAYLPGYIDYDNALLIELKKAYSEAIRSGMSKKDSWSIVLYVLCSSPVFEKL